MFESIKENIIQQCRRYNAECEIKEYYLSQWPADWPFCGYGGIYVILNESEEVIYIGETTDFGRRLSQHFSGDSNNKVKCNHDWLNPYCILVVKLQDNSLRLTIEERLISFYDPMYNKKKVFKAKYQVKTTEQIIPNSSSNYEEFRRKISRYIEIQRLVNMLRKGLKFKSFVKIIIEGCKFGIPEEEFVFDTSAFFEALHDEECNQGEESRKKTTGVLADEECNHSLMEKRQFDILLVDKNRNAIALCYHPRISADYPAPVDLKRFNLNHCVQLLFMLYDADEKIVMPHDGYRRYYFPERYFRYMLNVAETAVNEWKTIHPKSEIYERLDKERIGFNEDNQKCLDEYLRRLEKANITKYDEEKDIYVVIHNGIQDQDIAYWYKKVFKELLDVTNKDGVPWRCVYRLLYKPDGAWFQEYNSDNLRKVTSKSRLTFKKEMEIENRFKRWANGIDLFPSKADVLEKLNKNK